jgi:hypothetical protein
MPPLKGFPKSEAAAKGQVLGSMKNFFSVKKEIGRPSRTSPNAGRPTGAEKRPAQALAAPPADAAKAPADKPKKLKLTRANWSKCEVLNNMADSITDWDAELQKAENKRMSLHLLAEMQNIPYTPLQTHITTNDSKRIKLGSGVGKKRVIDHSTTEITADVLVRKGRANQGAGVGEALDLLERMCPKSTRSQLDQACRRTVRPSFQDRLTKSVAAQPTTTKRTAITVLQQWCRLPAAVCGVARQKRSFLQGGLSFKLEGNSADVYSLLPSFWNAVGPIE